LQVAVAAHLQDAASAVTATGTTQRSREASTAVVDEGHRSREAVTVTVTAVAAEAAAVAAAGPMQMTNAQVELSQEISSYMHAAHSTTSAQREVRCRLQETPHRPAGTRVAIPGAHIWYSATAWTEQYALPTLAPPTPVLFVERAAPR
jgi:hypothetical protein